jgi:hypothetical protein
MDCLQKQRETYTANLPYLQVPTATFAKVIDLPLTTNQRTDMRTHPDPLNQNHQVMMSDVKVFRCCEQIAFLASLFLL